MIRGRRTDPRELQGVLLLRRPAWQPLRIAGGFGRAVRPAAQRRLAWLAAVFLATGCSSAQLRPELADSAAKVRVVSQPEAVAGCRLLSAVTASGYTSRSGIVYDTGTPAITLAASQSRQLRCEHPAIDEQHAELPVRL